MDLVGTAALLGGAEETDRLEHLVQWDFCALKNGADFHGELLAAVGTLTETDTGFPQIVVLAAHGAAVGAHRTFGPQKALDLRKGGGFVVEVRGGQGGHRLGSDAQTLPPTSVVCKVYNRPP